jgi:hypothetical protein
LEPLVVVLDLEATGRSPVYERVIQIAARAVGVNSSESGGGGYNAYVLPGKPVPVEVVLKRAAAEIAKESSSAPSSSSIGAGGGTSSSSTSSFSTSSTSTSTSSTTSFYVPLVNAEIEALTGISQSFLEEEGLGFGEVGIELTNELTN